MKLEVGISDHTYKFANWNNPDDFHQECDPVKYPNIDDFCWKWNTHGHNAIGCRGTPVLGQWETQADVVGHMVFVIYHVSEGGAREERGRSKGGAR